jgi:signal transduction histidine kinase
MDKKETPGLAPAVVKRKRQEKALSVQTPKPKKHASEANGWRTSIEAIHTAIHHASSLEELYCQLKSFSTPPGEFPAAALADLLVAGIQRAQQLQERRSLQQQNLTKPNSAEQPAAETETRRRDEEQENFVYVVSHNLKAPLASIQGFANILHEELGPRLSKEHRHFLERLRQNAALMEKMVRDLLEFSRLGRYPFTFEMVNVEALVENVIEEMRLLGQLQDVEFIFSPANFDELRLYADGDELKTVFENLLSNAVKYRKPNATLRLEIGWEEQPRFHALWVRDNGIGMEPAFQARAFDLFQRGANVGKIQGTGIGLAIVRRIIENHQGLVRVDSRLGEGTTFYFTLPKLDAPSTALSRKAPKLNSSAQ